MTRLLSSRTALVLVLGLLASLATIRPATAQVVINEILADPASDWDGDGTVDTLADEWVEVLNTGAAVVDLADYWLRDDAVDTPRMRLEGILAPGGAAVFFGSDAAAWQETTGLSGSALSLNNAGDTVVLLRTVPGSDPLAIEAVDTVTYLSHTAEDDRSSGWDTHQVTWVLYDGLNPYTGSFEPGPTGCPPTPGAPNLCNGEVAGEKLSFSAVKVLFR